MTRNRPTPEGRELGAELARLTGPVPDACKSCAFRENSIPNGCGTTLLDAIECVVTGETFFCHETLRADGEPLLICRGYLAARAKLTGGYDG